MLSYSLEGQTLGKYRVLEPLGRGGMARVYRAYHPQLDRYVAIKVMRSDLLEDGTFGADSWRARFRREARAVASLRHANIVQVYDFDVEGDVYYMVMELLEGDTLKAHLNDCRARGERISRGETVRVLLDVLDALAYAHSEGMIHRDVKPGNILLTRRGQAVLTDFGIAQMVGGTRHTAAGALMGTLSYMAPEQGLEGQCDARGDIYSLGIVFYELLTGDTPYDADTPLAILMKHLNDPLPLPRQVDPTIPESFERVALKALAKRPEERYQSAAEMAEALQEAVAAAGVELPVRVAVSANGASFLPEQVLPESVEVFSGKARDDIRDAVFAEEATDPALGQRLAAESLVYTSPEALASEASHSDTREVAQGTVQSRRHRAEPEPVSGSASIAAYGATSDKGAYPQLVMQLLELDFPRVRIAMWKAVLIAVGILAAVNSALVMFPGAIGLWKIWEFVWPIEFMLVALVLCVLLYGTGSLWLLIPTSILVGNGLLFSYYSLSGKWDHWTFLWPLELLILGGSVGLTLWLVRYKDVSRQLCRRLSWLSGLVAIGWSMLIVAMAFGVAVVAAAARG